MDIVERLRHHKSSDVWTERKDRTWYETDDLCMEAADEIERLREALEDIAKEQFAKNAIIAADLFQRIARAALKEKEVMNKIDEEVQRVLKWIECRGYKDVFTVDTVITDLAPINHLSFQQVVDVLNQEVRKGNIEIVASKDLKWPLLKRIRKMDKSIERRFEVIEMMLQKISDKVDALPEKKQRLWNPWTNSKDMKAPEKMIDVMLANGEIIPKFSGRELNWLDNMDPDKKIVAWRDVE